MAAKQPLDIRIKRAYTPPTRDDGVRILIDRLWPRAIRKTDLAIDRWLKEAAPSNELRRWFGHDPERWNEFCAHYRQELTQQPAILDELRATARKGTLTLIYAARDEAHNDAVALRDMLLRPGRAAKAKAPATKPAASKRRSKAARPRRASSRRAPR
jgi:uncharacterized protein YeaO (DUF488 family)